MNRNQIIDYLRQTYGTEPNFPWLRYPGYCTFKTAHSQKWYAIIMNIKPVHLGLNGTDMIDVINVKIRPETRQSIIDHQHFFPGYHMNKRTWLTIVLDQTTDPRQIQTLLDESYRLVEKL